LLSYPKPAEPANAVPVAAQQGKTSGAGEHSRIESSFGGRLGKAIEPAIAPLGFDWRLGVGIVGAFAAREVFVSTLGLVYGLDDLDDEAVPLREKMRSERRENGAPVYTPLVGLSLMIFFALSCQCMSTLAVVRRETKSIRWPAFMFVYMTGLAYVTSLVVYQGGRWLGF
jgi:ferrous iron transport protein B